MRRSNNKKLLAMLLALALPACISLPEQQSKTPQHYSLLAANSSCQAQTHSPIKLAITRVASGLEGDRIIQRSSQTGEIVYLSNMRWPNTSLAVLEQRLAQDLETAGFSIITSHQQLASNPQLNCELRALNLIKQGQQHSAAFALSCTLYKPGVKMQQSIYAKQQVELEQINTNSIALALSKSYALGFEQLCQRLSQELPD